MRGFSMIFHTFAVFHDYPGLEYGLPKFHDFPSPVVTLCHCHARGLGYTHVPHVCSSLARRSSHL